MGKGRTILTGNDNAFSPEFKVLVELKMGQLIVVCIKTCISCPDLRTCADSNRKAGERYCQRLQDAMRRSGGV